MDPGKIKWRIISNKMGLLAPGHRQLSTLSQHVLSLTQIHKHLLFSCWWVFSEDHERHEIIQISPLA